MIVQVSCRLPYIRRECSPSERLKLLCFEHPEAVLRSLDVISQGDDLQVLLPSQRHKRVLRYAGGVIPANVGPDPRRRFDLANAFVQVGDRDDDVVEMVHE